MQVDPSESSASSSPAARPPERTAILIAMALVLLYVLWTLRTQQSPSARPVVPPNSAGPAAVTAEMIPLVSGDEPIVEIFTKAGCPVCHMIPGIPGANGQVGPPLTLGVTGPQRLADPSYRGAARTVHEYVVESVVDPSVFVAQGYPERTMPAWYGTKLSGLALQKIAEYLEQETGNNLGK